MLDEKLIDLIKFLKERTNENKLRWDKTGRENEFYCNLSSGKITVDSWDDERGDKMADIVIYNDVGEVILTHSAEKAEILNNVLKEAGVVIYSQQPGAGVYKERKMDDTTGNQASTHSPHEHVVDADFEENN